MMWSISKINLAGLLLIFISVECMSSSYTGLQGYFQAARRGTIKSRIYAPKRIRRSAEQEWLKYFERRQEDGVPQIYAPPYYSSDERVSLQSEEGFQEYPRYRVIPGYEGSEIEIEPSNEGHKIIINPVRIGHSIMLYENDPIQEFIRDPESVPPQTPLEAPLNPFSDVDSGNNESDESAQELGNPSEENEQELGKLFEETGELPEESEQEPGERSEENVQETEELSEESERKPGKKENDQEVQKSSSEMQRQLQPQETTSVSSEVQHVDFNKEADFLTALESDAEGSGEIESQDGTDSIQIRIVQPLKSRFVNLFIDENDTTVCTTPNNEQGHCRHVTQCAMKDMINNFNVYFDYLCMIKATFVGICCPDNPVIITDPDFKNDTIERDESTNQPNEGCGFSSRTRIVGGEISKPHEWTWMVALLRRNRLFCGGALINNFYVITAAHCTLGLNIKDITVRLGEHNITNRTKLQQDIPLAEIKRHRGFTTLTFQHDIALLKLRHPAEFSRVVGTICLPPPGNSFVNAKATVVGWGTMSFGGAASPVLRQATIPVWNNTDCDRTFALEKIDESFLCAGMPNDEQDACQGDSGGPLMAVNEDGRWEVIGLVSWGRRCGDPDFPGVYTRVTTYLDWIQENSQ